MRLLGIAASGLVPARLGDRVGLAILGLHQLGDLTERRIGDRDRVGSHVGDQADRAVAGEVDTFIEALRDLHRPAGAEPQLARGLLLQRRGRERRRGRSLALLLLNGGDAVPRVAERGGVRVGVAVGAEDETLLVRTRCQLPIGHLNEPCNERLLRVLGREADVDAPILHRVERIDLALALDDQPHGHRLDTAGRKARLHALPQQRRDLVPDQAVEDPPRLLGVGEVPVDPAGVREGIEDRVARDLGERDPVGLPGVLPEEGGHVHGDRLALTVEVGCQHEPVGGLHRPLQDGDVLLGALRHLVLDLEVVLRVDPELGLGQVADVAVRGPDHELGPQVALDRLRLGRRLDHDQRLRHRFLFLFLRTPGPRGPPVADGTTASTQNRDLSIHGR